MFVPQPPQRLNTSVFHESDLEGVDESTEHSAQQVQDRNEVQEGGQTVEVVSAVNSGDGVRASISVSACEDSQSSRGRRRSSVGWNQPANEDGGTTSPADTSGAPRRLSVTSTTKTKTHHLRRRSSARASPREAFGSIPAVVPRRIAWRQIRILGMGAFGKVYLGLDQTSGRLLAAKEFSFEVSSDVAAERAIALQREIQIMKKVQHPNVVSYFGADRRGKDGFYIFMEYVPGGSLLGLLKDCGPLKESNAARYIAQVLTGVAFLHESNVVHRDIKCANLLITVEGVIKLADFGSAQLKEAKTKLMSMEGTANWMAPEVIRSEPASFASDIWSIGCTVMEMLTGGPPWIHLGNNFRVMALIGGADRTPRFPIELDSISIDCRSFLLLCLEPNSHARPTARSLLSHPFLLRHLDPSVNSSCADSLLASSFQADFYTSMAFGGEDSVAFGAKELSPPSGSLSPLSQSSPPNNSIQQKSSAENDPLTIHSFSVNEEDNKLQTQPSGSSDGGVPTSLTSPPLLSPSSETKEAESSSKGEGPRQRLGSNGGTSSHNALIANSAAVSATWYNTPETSGSEEHPQEVGGEGPQPQGTSDLPPVAPAGTSFTTSKPSTSNDASMTSPRRTLSTVSAASIRNTMSSKHQQSIVAQAFNACGTDIKKVTPSNSPTTGYLAPIGGSFVQSATLTSNESLVSVIKAGFEMEGLITSSPNNNGSELPVSGGGGGGDGSGTPEVFVAVLDHPELEVVDPLSEEEGADTSLAGQPSGGFSWGLPPAPPHTASKGVLVEGGPSLPGHVFQQHQRDSFETNCSYTNSGSDETAALRVSQQTLMYTDSSMGSIESGTRQKYYLVKRESTNTATPGDDSTTANRSSSVNSEVERETSSSELRVRVLAGLLVAAVLMILGLVVALIVVASK